jgi:uncharacterized protein YbaP (TraB family)
MRKTLKTAFLAASFLLAPPALAQATAPAPAPATAKLPDTDPALWVVKDKDTTIYLFGTFHALDGKTDWFNDEVRAAFDRSSKVYLEIIQPDPAAAAPLMQKYAMASDGKPLTSKLSEKGKKDFAEALASLGAPPTAFDKFKPFFASMMLSVLQAQKLGKTGERVRKRSSPPPPSRPASRWISSKRSNSSSACSTRYRKPSRSSCSNMARRP